MRNRKGMALVTLLAFLALAMLLFAGMITAFQTSVARDKGEFEDQQVLMMAESHMELAKNELGNKDTIKEVLAGRSTEQEFLSSKYQDIESKVNYKLKSKSCTDLDNVETCTYPLTLTSTSSMRGATRTLKAETAIIKTTTTSGVPDDLIKTIANTLTIGKIEGENGEHLYKENDELFIGIKEKGDKKFAKIVGTVEEIGDSNQFKSIYSKSDFETLASCSFGTTITSSCIISNLTNKDITVSPNDNEIIQLIVNKDTTFEKSKIINAGGVNSAVVITIFNDYSLETPTDNTLTFSESEFIYEGNYETSSKQNVIISNSTSSSPTLILDGKKDALKIDGLIYTPHSIIELGNGASESKTINGAIVTKTFNYPQSQNNSFNLTHANINLGMFCSSGSFCPFVEKTDDGGEGGEGEDGDTDADGTTVITYSLGAFKYEK